MGNDESTRIGLPDGSSVSALLTEGTSPVTWTLVYAPGAGSSLRDPFGTFLTKVLPPLGISVLRFQFPYAEAGKRLPDRPPVLEATWRAALDAARERGGALVASGRSMGGRIASQVVAQGAALDALALLAYPLHPPGKPEQRRDQHLPAVAVPTLFCSGTKDAFGTPGELQGAVALVPHAALHLLEGADHSFNAAKATGRTRHDVWVECGDTIVAWLGGIGRATPTPPRSA